MGKIANKVVRALNTLSLRFTRAQHWLNRHIRRRGRWVIVAAMPKSASTFVGAALGNATGFLNQFLSQSHDSEQDLLYSRLVDFYPMNLICVQHVRATPPSLALMRQFSIRPVVLVRNLEDVAASIFDELKSRDRHAPIFYLHERFYDLPKHDWIDAIIDLHMPWLVQFFAGWRMAADTGEIEILFLQYDELIADPETALGKILEFNDLNGSRVDVAAGIEQANAARSNLRFNKGVSGRGAELLTPDQRKRIRALARHFPDIDFTPVLPPLENRADLETKR